MRRSEPGGASHRQPDVSLRGLTGGGEGWQGWGVIDCLESFQKGTPSELGFEVQIEICHAANEGRVLHVQGLASVRAQKHYMASLPNIPTSVDDSVAPIWAGAVLLPGPGQLDNRL